MVLENGEETPLGTYCVVFTSISVHLKAVSFQNVIIMKHGAVNASTFLCLIVGSSPFVSLFCPSSAPFLAVFSELRSGMEGEGVKM